MKWTKEDIEKAKKYLSKEGYGSGSNFTVSSVSNLMAEYAAYVKAENLPISLVSISTVFEKRNLKTKL